MSDKLFDSSDSVRSARPLRHAQSVTFDGPVALESGGSLPSVTICYETYGSLNAARDNAILVCHALSGDSHVARHDPEDEPGWWDILIGPGKAIDTDRFFVVCPNLLGSCRGSTGPGSTNPDTGKPYGRDFPVVTVGDMVEAERRLADHLGVGCWLAVIGGSLGGHQTILWATRYPDRVRGAVPIATSPRLTSQALAFDVVGRNAIRRDAHFYSGQYYDKPHGPDVGLALARMIGHITYLSPAAMKQKFGANRLQPRDVAIEFEKTFSVGSYLGYQGSKFVERFDANSYMVITMAIDLFDIGDTPEKLAATFRTAKCRWLVLSFTSDWLFPPEQSRDMVNALIANNAAVSYCNIQSDCGHDAFLLTNELASYGEMIRGFINNLAGQSKLNGAFDDADEPRGQSPTSIFHQRRIDYERLVELIPSGASVLDLGSGRGGLLARAKQKDSHRLIGVELDEQAIITCIQRGLDVVQADLNKGLRSFADQQFDCVVLSQTLQAVHDVEGVIADMLRVGRLCIVSFPNFGFHKLRRMLAEEGRSPKAAGVLHHEWYNTPNIRFFTIADFDDFCRQKNIHVHRRIALDTEASTEVFEDPNLNADIAIFVISRSAHAA